MGLSATILQQELLDRVFEKRFQKLKVTLRRVRVTDRRFHFFSVSGETDKEFEIGKLKENRKKPYGYEIQRKGENKERESER